jgi:hypothetical protein
VQIYEEERRTNLAKEKEMEKEKENNLIQRSQEAKKRKFSRADGSRADGAMKK